MTVNQLMALDAIGPEVCDLRDHMRALAAHFPPDDPDLAPALRKALTFLNRAAAQLEFMVDEVEVRQEDTKQPER
jgi:hypothetical protein